jgi:hypothetical protein
MKRKLKWIGAFLLVLLVGLGTALFLWPRDRITAASWEKIRLDMSLEEVERILGGGAISWEEYHARWLALMKSGRSQVNDCLEEGRGVFGGVKIENNRYWIGPRGYLEIEFEHGRVVGKYFCEFRSADPSFLDRIRDWLGW